MLAAVATPAAAKPAAAKASPQRAARALAAGLAPKVGPVSASCRRRTGRGRRLRFSCRWRSPRGCRGRHVVVPRRRVLGPRRRRWRIARGSSHCPPASQPPASQPPASQPPPRRPLFGLNDNAVVRGQASAADDAQLNAGLGVDVVRVTVDWRWAERQPDDYRLAHYDAIYAESLARGIRPVWIPLFAPSWAIDPSTPCNQWLRDCRHPPGPAFDGEYAQFAALLASRYPQSAAIEIWNEPNIRYFWRPDPDPARYAALLKASYAAVKRANPSMTVAGGALGDDPDWSNAVPFQPYARALYAEGARGHMDVFSFHPYPHIPGHVDRTLAEARTERARAGDEETPLWVTETGWSTSGAGDPHWPVSWVVSEQEQADRLVALHRKLMAEPDVEAVMFHTLIEPEGDPSASAGPGYGIVRGDLSPKPAYCALAAERLGAAPC